MSYHYLCIMCHFSKEGKSIYLDTIYIITFYGSLKACDARVANFRKEQIHEINTFHKIIPSFFITPDIIIPFSSGWNKRLSNHPSVLPLVPQNFTSLTRNSRTNFPPIPHLVLSVLPHIRYSKGSVIVHLKMSLQQHMVGVEGGRERRLHQEAVKMLSGRFLSQKIAPSRRNMKYWIGHLDMDLSLRYN